MTQKTKQQKQTPPPEKKAFQGKQLDLFQDFLCNTPAEQERLSNTIELWDAVPKYHINRRRQGKLRKDGFLPTAERNFMFRGKEVTVKIRPARITATKIKSFIRRPGKSLLKMRYARWHVNQVKAIWTATAVGLCLRFTNCGTNSKRLGTPYLFHKP